MRTRLCADEQWRAMFESPEIDKLWVSAMAKEQPDISLSYGDITICVSGNDLPKEIPVPSLAIIQSELDPVEDLERIAFQTYGSGYAKKVYRGAAKIKICSMYRCILIPLNHKNTNLDSIRNQCLVLKRAGVISMILDDAVVPKEEQNNEAKNKE